MYYYKPDDNVFYFTTNKNGSTILAEIADDSGKLKNLSLSSCLEIISKNDSTIRIPFRHPFPRFVSGLSVNLHNCTDGEFAVDLHGNTPNFTLSVHYQNFLRYFYHSVFGPSAVFERDRFAPYHLFDRHLDHWLFVPVILLFYKYKVELIPMFDFSEHLLLQFPDSKNVIKTRERKNSFDSVHDELVPFWNAYKYSIVDNTNFSCSWDHWMDPEIKIFESLVEGVESSNSVDTDHLIKYIFENKYYFGDLYAPRTRELMELLQAIHAYKDPDQKFLKLTKNFHDFVDKIKIYSDIS